MSVRLIGITKPEIPEKELSPEEFVVYTARVSSPSNQLNTATSDRLIRYLVEHKHWSPFEMVDLVFEVQTTRGIAPQVLRHKSLNFQEFSLRYAKAPEIKVVEARAQDTKNRQLSHDSLSQEIKDWFRDTQLDLNARAMRAYEEALDRGVAKECARFLLPMSTATTMYVKGSLRSIIHYCEVRCDEGTQSEHRDIALAVRKLTGERFPNIAKALGWPS